MIPGTYDFTVYRGSPVDIPLSFVSGTTGGPISFAGFIEADGYRMRVADGLLDSNDDPVVFPDLTYAGIDSGNSVWSSDGLPTDPGSGTWYFAWVNGTSLVLGTSVDGDNGLTALWTAAVPTGGTPADGTLWSATNGTGTPAITDAPRRFTAQVRDNPDSPVLLSFTVTSTDLAGGLLNLAATVANTATIPQRDCRWDLIDYTGAVWLEGVCKLRKKISTL